MKSVSKLLHNLRTSAAAVVAALLITSLFVCGCTPQQQATAKQVVAKIGAEIPNALPILQTAGSVAAAMLPEYSSTVTAVSGDVSAGLAELAALCNTYGSNPSDSVWQSIQATVNTLTTSGASALLDAAKITDPVSRQKAQEYLGGLQTVLLIIDGFVQSAQTKAQVKATASLRSVKLREMAPYLDRKQVEQATGYSFDAVYSYETALGF